MKTLKRLSIMMLLVSSIFMTGCDATQIIDMIQKVAQGVQQAMPAIQNIVNTFAGIFGNNNNNAAADNTQQAAQTATNTAAVEEDKKEEANVVTIDPDKEEVASATTNTTTEAGATGNTVTVATQTATTNTPAVATQTATTNQTAAVEVSAAAKKQMDDVVAYALANHRGGSNGDCFNAVWDYLTKSGYGNLKAWGDLPLMQSGEARHFAEYLNASQRNLDEAGLKRLDTTLNPPITSPHDPRIPKGAVIVVAPKSYGTSHETAGDIVIKAGEGRFVNDGPNMDYGTASTWYGKVLGVYIPK